MTSFPFHIFGFIQCVIIFFFYPIIRGRTKGDEYTIAQLLVPLWSGSGGGGIPKDVRLESFQTFCRLLKVLKEEKFSPVNLEYPFSFGR